MFRILFFSIWLLFHPVHVSLTSIDYMQEKGCFKVFVRIYFDDFLIDSRINEEGIEKIDFSVGNSSSMIFMERYLTEKVIIKVNEKQLSGKLLDLKLVDNEISMNLEYITGKKPKIINVKNIIMTDLYRDQSNMIILRLNDFEEGVKLTPDETEHYFKIK